MAISYSWQFPSLKIVYSEDDLQNVVSSVEWVLVASDGEYKASAYGSASLPTPGQPFVPFESITPEIVQGWVVSTLGAEYVSELEASLAGQIEQQKNPAGATVTPPWV